jgi:protein SCO1/2
VYRLPALLLVGFVLLAGCSRREPARQYLLKGQVIAIGTSPVVGGTEITMNHEDIPGFMPAMTMAYFLKKGERADGIGPGDLVTATLVVDGAALWVQDLRKTGHAPLPADAHPVRIMDVMAPGDVVPDDPLVDQAGADRRFSNWRGQALAVTFVYTRCPVPDFCPLMDRRFGDLQRAVLRDPALRDGVHLASISFDPRHDTREAIAAHAKTRGADPRVWSYLTGDPAVIDHITSRFGVSVIDEHDTPQSITHNLRTAVIDAQGKLVKIYDGNEWTVDALLADLRDARKR